MNFISYKSKSNWMLLFLIPNPLFLGPTFGIWHNSQKEKELEQYGVKGKGVVTELKFQRGESRNSWKTKCEFIVNNEKYDAIFVELISGHEDLPPYRIGDTVELTYSSIFPKIHDVESKYEKKYNTK